MAAARLEASICGGCPLFQTPRITTQRRIKTRSKRTTPTPSRRVTGGYQGPRFIGRTELSGHGTVSW